METRHTIKMADEYPSTDESDIDAFLEYAREKVAENNTSYDSASFRNFEGLLQNCIANHFIEGGGAGIDEDSMASEASFSGYVNEGCDTASRYNKSAYLMSDNAYHRMKGIIAHKKDASLSDRIQSITSPETDTSTISSNDSRMQYMTSLTKFKLLQGNEARNDSMQSDSSDSILDDMLPRQTRQRRPRRRIRNKKQLRGESINFVSENHIVLIDQGDFTHSSIPSINATSNALIDTTNVILPSLVKKGTKYCDIPKIESMLARMSRKTHTMNRKQKVLNQLLKTRPVQSDNTNGPLTGMALVHKLRAERKMALQAAFLRHNAKEKEDEIEQSTRLGVQKAEKREISTTLKTEHYEREIVVPAANLVQSPSSLSSFSSTEGKNRFQTFVDKTKRTLSYSFHRQDKEGLLQKHFDDEFWMNSSYSSLDEAAFFPKSVSPFGKIKFSRLKINSRYAELSTSSLSNDSWNDSGNYSSPAGSSDPNNQGENRLHSSDHSYWSEMSFTSDRNRSTVFCFRNKSQAQSSQVAILPTIRCSGSKAFDDSFDELVLRNESNLGGGSFSIRVGDESPTGIMDFRFNSPMQKHKKDTNNALAFVDEDDGNHVFTDNKDDSSLLKSPDEIPSPLCQPVFFSRNRFEI